MSILKSNKRQVENFRPENPNHRKMFNQFQKERSWGKLPVTFVLEPEYSDLVAMTTDKMMKFYMSNDRELK
jgi:hypothetical protein